MKDISHLALTFFRSKPRDEEYNFIIAEACAFYQFAVAHGIPNPIRSNNPEREPLPASLRGALSTYPWTFGALADRLEAILAEQVAS